MDCKNCKAYELVQKEQIEELNSTGYLLFHKKTRARIVLLENKDNNKVFNIGFRTPPKDSTGVAHIIEHTVLCGSEKFPVKDPFTELAKGSLNTFLNAMTYPDKTMYPVASCNDKDFQNLMNVYLDAVFFPNIYKEDKIFKQEGWHYELEDVDAPLTYNGVVYNEMKGVFSSPDEIFERAIQQSVLPHTAYGVESGGDPSEIPELTYEKYLDFHRKYYHPSNSYIYLYGDMDMEEKLNWLDKEYLSRFDYLEVDSEIETEPAFDKMQEKYCFYPATEDEDVEGKAFFSYNAVCGNSLDTKLYLAFQILNYVLVQGVGAPLKQGLTDAGIGNDISGSYDESIKQPIFSIVAKNVKMEQKNEFIAKVREILSRLVEEGLNERSLRAAINAQEFQFREADFGSYPKGLMYGLQLYDSWLYDDEKPFIHLKANETFAFLKEQVGTGYYENLIKTYLLDNTHVSFVSAEPKVGLSAQMEQEEKEKLREYRDTLSREQLEQLVKETKELRAYQEEETPQKLLTCIPVLEREDIGKQALAFKNEERKIGEMPVLFHNIFTNGINYVKLSFDVKDLLPYAPYLSLLAELIGFVDTDKHDKLELSNEVLLHAGNFATNLNLYYNKKQNGEYAARMEIVTKVLFSETGYVLSLLHEMMTESHLDDTKRIKEIISEARSARQISLQSAGHSTTAGRAEAYHSEAGVYNEQIKGVAYYEFLCDLEKNFEEKKDELVCILQKLCQEIFTRKRLLIDITSTEEGYQTLAEQGKPVLETLSAGQEKPELPENPYKNTIGYNEGFQTAGKVQYVARIGNFKDAGFAYKGTYHVLRTILNYGFLYNEVRIKGGAYGIMCNFARDGRCYMVSYRDPKLRETNEVYERVPEYLDNFEASERDMVKYIIGTISELDTPLPPRAEGNRSYQAYLTEVTSEEVQKSREEILETDVEKVRQTADMVRAVLSKPYLCVLGGEEKVKENCDMFDEIRVLN